MDKRLSKRVEKLSESATLKMTQLARQLKSQGKDIISLSIGEPDFNTPEDVKQAGIDAINQNITHYPPVPGFPELRKAVAGKYKKDYNLDFEMNQVVVSNGAKQSLSNLMLSLLDEGDEVVVPSPYWVSYPEMIKLAGAKAVVVKAGIDQDFKVTAQQVEEAITDKTRMFLFSTPSNPSGAVFCLSELQELAEVFRKYPDIIIVSDEIYEYINFIASPCSFAQFTDLAERVVVVNGVSKGYAMTGWRIGYLLAPEWIASATNKLQGQLTSGASTISQMAALKAIQKGDVDAMEMKKSFQRRRDLVLGELKKIPGIKFNQPEGAFYSLIDVSDYFGKTFNNKPIADANDLAMFLLEEAHVSTVSGSAFGIDECIRISFATSDDKLVEAMNRIRKALEMLK